MKVMLAIEIVICFGPVLVLLSIGVWLLPQQLIFLVIEPNLSSMLFVLWLLGGALGVSGLYRVVGSLYGRPLRPFHRSYTLAKCIVGIAALLPFVVAFSDVSRVLRLASLLPIAAALHIVFLWYDAGRARGN